MFNGTSTVFTVNALNGNTNIAGTLGAGATTLNSLTVTNNAAVGSLNVTGATTGTGWNVNATGTGTFANLVDNGTFGLSTNNTLTCNSGQTVTATTATGEITTGDNLLFNGSGGTEHTWTCTLSDTQITAGARIYLSVSNVTANVTLQLSDCNPGANIATIRVCNPSGVTQAPAS